MSFLDGLCFHGSRSLWRLSLSLSLSLCGAQEKDKHEAQEEAKYFVVALEDIACTVADLPQPGLLNIKEVLRRFLLSIHEGHRVSLCEANHCFFPLCARD